MENFFKKINTNYDLEESILNLKFVIQLNK